MARTFTCKCCRRILPANPRCKNQEYVEMWDLEDAEAVTAAMIGGFAAELRERVDVVLAMPVERRGPPPW